MKKLLKLGLFIGGILFLGGVGGVLLDRLVLPWLSTKASFRAFPILRSLADNVTVINKTEQIVVREDDSIERIVSQPSTAVVNIIARPKLLVGGSGVKSFTGVLLTNDGLIVSYHEVSPDPASEYRVLLYDGSSHEGSFVGFDRLTNLAFFRISVSSVPSIALANSDDARVGKKLIAIGNAYEEYQNRFSYGILNTINKTFNLSGKSVASSEKWEGVFAMEMPEVEEFVGGPAIQYNGEMLGLIGSLTIDNQVRAFVLPSNAVRGAMDRLIAGKLASRPSLGLYYLPITKVYAVAHDLSRDRGALVYAASGKTGLAVLSGSAAERAGIEVNDIIIAVDGKEVNLANPLSVLLSGYESGDTVTLLIVRRGEERSLSVTLH